MFINGRIYLEAEIAEIRETLHDGDHALYEKIKTIKSNMESANTNLKDRIASDFKAYSKALDYCFFLSSQIQRTNVSLVMNKVIRSIKMRKNFPLVISPRSWQRAT